MLILVTDGSKPNSMKAPLNFTITYGYETEYEDAILILLTDGTLNSVEHNYP